MNGSYLSIEDIVVQFNTESGPFTALQGVTLKVERGEHVSIIGHSGCGKSTLLNVVAGLQESARGAVLLEEREVNEPGPDRAMVFQNHSLLPWLTVYGNVKLAVNKVYGRIKTETERHAWILHNLELVHMADAQHKRPGEISGGISAAEWMTTQCG